MFDTEPHKQERETKEEDVLTTLTLPSLFLPICITQEPSSVSNLAIQHQGPTSNPEDRNQQPFLGLQGLPSVGDLNQTPTFQSPLTFVNSGGRYSFH